MSSVVKKIQYIVFLIFALFAVASCSSDDSLTQEAPADEYVAKAKELLNGDVVLSTESNHEWC